jgi:predicted secreted protein
MGIRDIQDRISEIITGEEKFDILDYPVPDRFTKRDDNGIEFTRHARLRIKMKTGEVIEVKGTVFTRHGEVGDEVDAEEGTNELNVSVISIFDDVKTPLYTVGPTSDSDQMMKRVKNFFRKTYKSKDICKQHNKLNNTDLSLEEFEELLFKMKF